MTVRINVVVEVEVPQAPNFLRKPDGSTVPIEIIQEKGLREIGHLWTEELVKKAAKKNIKDVEDK